MKSDNVIRCDRQVFIDCTNGILLNRVGNKILSLGDLGTRAVEAAERGEKVILQIDGQDVSYILDHQEFALEEE